MNILHNGEKENLIQNIQKLNLFSIVIVEILVLIMLLSSFYNLDTNISFQLIYSKYSDRTKIINIFISFWYINNFSWYIWEQLLLFILTYENSCYYSFYFPYLNKWLLYWKVRSYNDMYLLHLNWHTLFNNTKLYFFIHRNDAIFFNNNILLQ